MIKEVIRGNTIKETIDFVMEECCNCGIPFFMPTYLQKRLIANKGEPFYCPNGHSQHYSGPTEAQKLKQQLADIEQQRKEENQKWVDKYLDECNKNTKLEKKLKRVQNGVCPCCNRTFKGLHAHIKNMHPEFLTNSSS